MSNEVLQKLVTLVSDAPHSGAALTLFALFSTLEYENAGALFKLVKLRDLDAGNRQLAYQLMELMVAGKNQGDAWQQTKLEIETLIRNG